MAKAITPADFSFFSKPAKCTGDIRATRIEPGKVHPGQTPIRQAAESSRRFFTEGIR